jgi:predicted dehydrogenase
MSAAALSVLLVGCGSIAGGYDEDRAPDAAPLTHAGAYRQNQAFRLAACVEPDDARRHAFMRAWSIPQGYDRLDQIPADSRFDVISLCSPTEAHAEGVATALRLRPSVLFCEKPLAPNAAAAEALVDACADRGVLMAVNHTRRWAPDIVRLRDALAAGEFGAVRSISALYCKGILNNGSHMIDLIQYLVGPVTPIAALDSTIDAWPHDPTIPALLVAGAERTPVHLRTANAGDYSAFELEIVAQRGTLAMEDAGFSWRRRPVVDNPVFRGYRSLDTGTRSAGEYALAMSGAVANIEAAVRRGDALLSTGVTALSAQRVCEQIRNLAPRNHQQ